MVAPTLAVSCWFSTASELGICTRYNQTRLVNTINTTITTTTHNRELRARTGVKVRWQEQSEILQTPAFPTRCNRTICMQAFKRLLLLVWYNVGFTEVVPTFKRSIQFDFMPPRWGTAATKIPPPPPSPTPRWEPRTIKGSLLLRLYSWSGYSRTWN